MTSGESESYEDLMGVLEREYTSFFDPMEREYYDAGVSFDDPLSSLSGIDAYAGNVDLLAGRTLPGQLLFGSDAGIALHSVRRTGEHALRTRWTLWLTLQLLPWVPTARFTGVSDYTIRPSDRRFVAQRDYWDSTDLAPGGDAAGSYTRSPKLSGVADFLAQLAPSAGGRGTPNGGPFELLRRASAYCVRRYAPGSPELAEGGVVAVASFGGGAEGGAGEEVAAATAEATLRAAVAADGLVAAEPSLGAGPRVVEARMDNGASRREVWIRLDRHDWD